MSGNSRQSKLDSGRTDGLSAAKALVEAGREYEADALYRSLHNPKSPNISILAPWADLCGRMGDFDMAVKLLGVAVKLPGGATLLPDLVELLLNAGRLLDARAILLKAPKAERRGWKFALQAARIADFEGRFDDAIQNYRKSIQTKPALILARLGLARTLAQAGRIDHSIDAYVALLGYQPENEAALRELLWLQGNKRNFAAALLTLARLESTGVDVARETAEILVSCMAICDWTSRTQLITKLTDRIREETECTLNPYSLLATVDDPLIHLCMGRCIAKTFAKHSKNIRCDDHFRVIRQAKKRRRIGYLAGDFHNHATSLLLTDVLKSHDCTHFDFICYDYSPDDGTQTRNQIIAAFQNYVCLTDSGPAACAAQIEKDRLDLLIDTKGYTDRTRSEILVFRPAPVQVSFLGYVGTQGGDWVDYVIADRYVLPLSEQCHWTERIVHLPNSYYPNGRNRPIPDMPSVQGRLARGLPENSFVFACFNSPYKITPDMFALWMAILRDIPNGVLWLLEDNEFVAKNLRIEASNAGICPSRIIFAQQLPVVDHINRHAYADLFLDTAPYGAHTSGADALWAAVPLITLPGRTFASRVGMSLLNAVGLPELVCYTAEAYTTLAKTIAHNTQMQESLRNRLVDARNKSPLFDAERFARDLENVYSEMVL